ncbi:MAG: hypothetical protein QW171_01670 [Candidatus Bilamarchaeaceae archaeon]
MNKTRPTMIALLICALITLGCIKTLGGNNYADEYLIRMSRTPALSPEGECTLGNCTCMVCERGPAFYRFFFSSIVGGRCIFDTACNETKLTEYRNTSSQLGQEYVWRPIMIGQGPSFADFGTANGLCNARLRMAVHWLTANEYRPYDLPDASRAICMLDKETLPVYVLYSEGKNIDVDRAGEIARILGKEGLPIITQGSVEGPVGPVVIVTELEFNSSDPEAVENVAGQVIAINENCNDFRNPNEPKIYCMVAVAPRIGDKAALDAVINSIDARYGEGAYKRYIHLVAYGLNSHYINGTNKYDCNGNRLIEDGRQFSSYALYRYGLPSIIPYILIDSGGSDLNNKCTWSENAVTDAYNSFFIYGIKALSRVGVIGAALYTTEGGSWNNPLHCTDCGVTTKYERKVAWFGNCQNYVGFEKGEGTNVEKIGTAIPPIHFSNVPGGICDVGESSTDALYSLLTSREGGYTDLLNPVMPTYQTEIESPWRCDACLSEAEDITVVYPVLKKHMPGSLPDYACTGYPEFEYYASRFNLDPMLLRAVALGESSFDSCAIAAICKPGTRSKFEVSVDIPKEITDVEVYQGDREEEVEEKGRNTKTKWCIPGSARAYRLGYPEMYDPRYEESGGTAGCYFENSEATPPRYTFRGMGLMQVMVPPYTYWPAEYREDGTDGPHEDIYEEGYKIDPTSVKIYCSEEYNPFNSSHSICAGALHLSDDMKRAKRWVEEHNDDCEKVKDLFGIEGNQQKKDILIGFVALYEYSGVWEDKTDTPDMCPSGTSPSECWVDEYCKAKTLVCEPDENGVCPEGCEEDASGKCKPKSSLCYNKANDFLEFIDCRIGKEYDNRYGIFKKMGYYAWLNRNCENSYCPSWKKLSEYGVQPQFPTDNPYNAESYLEWTQAHTSGQE